MFSCRNSAGTGGGSRNSRPEAKIFPWNRYETPSVTCGMRSRTAEEISRLVAAASTARQTARRRYLRRARSESMRCGGLWHRRRVIRRRWHSRIWYRMLRVAEVAGQLWPELNDTPEGEKK